MVIRLVVLLVLGLVLPHGTASAAAPPKFAPSDELAAARALIGSVRVGSAKNARTDEAIKGFVDSDENLHEILLSETYVEGTTTKHVVVFGGHYVEDGVVGDNDAQATDLSAAVYEIKNGKWALSAKVTELASEGQNGMAPGVTLRKMGADLHVIQVESHWRGQGCELTSTTLYVPGVTGFRNVLHLAVEANDNDNGKKTHFAYEGALSVDELSGPEHYDISFAVKGTYRNGAGKVVGVPTTTLVFRWKDGVYKPIDESPLVAGFWKQLQQPF